MWKKIKKAADKASEKAKEASEAARKKAEEAAEAAKKRAEEEAKAAAEAAAKAARRAEEEARKVAEEELKRQAEAVAEAARRAEEEAKKAAKRAEEEAILRAEQAAKALQEEANKLISDKVNSAIGSFVQQAKDIGDNAQELAKQIEEVQKELESLKELANINKLKEKILEKAEELSEEYLKSKLEPFQEQINLITIPDVELNLSDTTLNIDLLIYFLLPEDEEKASRESAIATITTNLKQNITKLKLPNVSANLNINKDGIQDVIEKRIEEEKNKLIQAFFATFFSEYVTVFNKLKQYLPEL
ncbi:hypothetical protein [Clostridium sporogenes]|uniref:hypothetical protein n=1 Tax=Clostridium sporogenes TaxID=1509 RepID=UPI00024BA014|nr:hypothetical protein [Clostridium sporogenes]EHN13392.1 hypothetical protein IYC_17855 [Clostridium sporogenes PA 3679]MDU4598971.1 hypothetical protein [Clostridium sporogenes]NFG50900.1 hypothetical protein [Clostridium sporogenes]NFR32581.1 hypothetical protein [Clostridium sporogenes]NFU09076.1 hypothetical protein [Clostridium sporogenes]